MPNIVLFELWIIFLSVPDGVSCCWSDTRCLPSVNLALHARQSCNQYLIFQWLGWNVDWLVHWEPWAPTPLAPHHSRAVQHLQCCWRWSDLCESVLFSLRTMVLDLQAPIFNPASPHAAANCPSESQSLLISGAKTMASPTKGREGILSPPNLKFCLLEILVSLFQWC